MSRATRDTAPAVVFLVLYTAVLAVLAYLYATKAVRWRSRYSFVLFHVVMRVVGMALGVAFSCLEWEDEAGGGPKFGGASLGFRGADLADFQSVCSPDRVPRLFRRGLLFPHPLRQP